MIHTLQHYEFIIFILNANAYTSVALRDTIADENEIVLGVPLTKTYLF